MYRILCQQIEMGYVPANSVKTHRKRYPMLPAVFVSINQAFSEIKSFCIDSREGFGQLMALDSY